MQQQQALQNPKDKWIPRYFLMFFALIALLDGIFVYIAVSTQTGLVTEHPYEKGLAYDKMLEKARAQAYINEEASYKNGVLRWKLPVENAVVTALVRRPVQDGYDFEITLSHMGSGVYEAKINTPLPGQWTAHLKALWDNREAQTSRTFIAP